MAERRMFAKSVINSGRFLRMPPTSRLLYYDLGMAADDDGIVEAYTVMRADGCTEDDLRVLIAKGFIRLLNEDLVTQIMDWKTNNLIKSDRYKASIYASLISDGTQVEHNWNTSGTQMEPQVSIGKDRIGKDTKYVAQHPPTIDEVKAYCSERNNGVNAEMWYAHYEANGWKVGRTPMKNWKAAVRTWEKGKAEYEEF